MDERLKQELGSLLSVPVQWDCPLRRYTSFGIGGPAAALVRVESVAELDRLYHFLEEKKLDWRIIGRGTNLLVRDEGFAGVAVILGDGFKKYDIQECDDIVSITAGAGCGLSRLATVCADNGYSGLEFATGIPGTLGGAVIMNAGAWGSSMADIVLSIDVMMSQGGKTYPREQLSFSYRKLDTIGKSWVVTGAGLRLTKKRRDDIQAVCRGYRERRKERQPSGYGNAGSIFKNPEGDSAGRLIEASGLKGLVVGDAQISTRHANFIVNRGKALAGDVLQLIAHIQEKVEKDSGILLDPEVHIL
jgi:UDP-N-acetylmuramate dehydrogenase